MFGWFDELKKWLNGGNKQQAKPAGQPAPQQQRTQQPIMAPGAAQSPQSQKQTVASQPQAPAIPTPPKQPQINIQADIQKQAQSNAINAASVGANRLQSSPDQQARIPKVFNQQGQQQWLAKDNAQKAKQQEIQNKIATTQENVQQTQQNIDRINQENKIKDQARDVIQAAPMPVRRAVAGVSSAVGKLPSDIAAGVGAIGATVSKDGTAIDTKFKDLNKWGTETSRRFDQDSAKLYNKDSDGFLGDVVQGAGQLGGDVATMFAPGGAAKLATKGAQVAGLAPKIATAASRAVQALSNPAKVSAIPSARYGLQETGDQYYNAKDAGKDDIQAGLTGIAAGATQYGLEKVGIDKFIKPGQGGLVANAAKRALTEGAQEGAQTFGSNAWEKTYNGDKNLMDDVLRSAAVGAVVGGAASPVVDAGHSTNATKPKVSNKTPQTQEEHIDAVNSGIVTPATARASVDDMVRTAENSDLGHDVRYRQGSASNRIYKLHDVTSLDQERMDFLYRRGYMTAQDTSGQVIDLKTGVLKRPETLSSLNPTGGLYVDYDPQSRASLKLSPNMTTLDNTDGGSPNDIVSIFRGAPSSQESLNPGDFITTSRDLAQSYAGEGGHVIEAPVQKGDIIDDLTEPLGNEYIYRPGTDLSQDVLYRLNEALRAGQISQHQFADLLGQHNAMFGEGRETVGLTDSISSPQGNALGATIDNPDGASAIQLSSKQSNPMDTYFHEAVHKALNDYMTTPERNAIIQSYAQDKRIERGTISQREHLRRTEELMAEDFIQYVANQNNKDIQPPAISKRISDVFARVFRRIQQMLFNRRNEGTLTPEYVQFYRDLHEGRFATREVIDKALRDNTPEMLAIGDQIDVLKRQFDTNPDNRERRVLSQQITGLQRELNSLREGMSNHQQAYRIAQSVDGSDVVVVENNIIQGVPARKINKTVRDYLNKEFKGKDYPLDFGGDGIGRINRDTIRKYMDPSQSFEDILIKGKMAGELPDILKVSKKSGQANDIKGHTFARDGFEYRKSRIQIDGQQFEVLINVGLNSKGKLVYAFNNIKRMPVNNSNRLFRSGDSVNSIANNPLVVNDKRFREEGKGRTKELRNAIDDEIAQTNPELFYNVEDIALGEGGDFNMPRLHVDDIRHYFGQAGLEDIPSRYKRRNGRRDIDQLAAAAGYDDIDSFVEAMQRNIDMRKRNRDNKKQLVDSRRDSEIVASAQAKIAKKRSDAESAIAEFKQDRKDAQLKGDKGLVREIEDMIHTIESDAGLKKTKFAKSRDVKVGGPRGKVTEYVASSYKDENNKDVSELIPLDRSRHTLKSGTVVDKDGRNVGSYVGIDERGQQYAYLQGKPVNITGILGDIDTWGNLNNATWDMDRMIEKNAPDKATARRVQKFTTVYKDHQEAAMKTEIVQKRVELAEEEKKLVDNLPKGVKKEQLSEDMFRVMEKKVSLEEITNRYGKDYIDSYMKPAVQRQRKEFDQILKETNASLEQNGFDSIPRRDNYITHIQEDPKFWEKVGLGISDMMQLGSSVDSDINPGKVRGAIPEEIVGNTSNTGARRKWNPFAQTRRGSAHQQDFFAAVDAYYEPMLFNKYMTPAASRARLIERTFRTFEKAKEIRADQLLDVADMGTARDMAGLNKQRTHKQYKADRSAPFVLAWQEYGNKLAGKSNKIDRAMLESGNGQKLLKVSTRLQGITGANTIPGSATAALAQTLSLPQTFARDSSKSFVKAIKDTVYYTGTGKKTRASKDGTRDPLMSSAFMRARYTDATTKRKTLMRKYTSKASIPMEAIERFTAEISWRSAFTEARKKGLGFDAAINEADIETKKTLAGRGIGDRPLLMDSKAVGALTQFGLEVNNMRLQFWNDFTPMQKSKFIVGAFALNWMYGLATGQTPLPDYLDATIDAFMDMLDWEDEDDTIGKKLGATGQRYLGETAKFIPGAGAAANLLPESLKTGLFGSDSDVSRFGTMAFMKVPEAGKKAFDGVMTGDMKKVGDAALMVTPTGHQVRRSIEGISTMANGSARTSTGNLTTTVNSENPLKWLQALLFGKSALSEVQAVYDNKTYATTKDQTKVYEKIKSEAGQEAANNYLDRIRTNSGSKGSKSSVVEGDATVAELKAKLDIGIEKGERKVVDGVVLRKDDSVDRDYYKQKAEALKDSNSDEAYRAYLEGYDLTTGTKYSREKDVKTGSELLDNLIKTDSNASSKKNSTASNAIGLFMDSTKYKKVPDWVKDRYYKEAGYSKQDVEYGALTKIGKDTKMDMLYRPLGDADHQKLLDTLYTHRKVSINNKYVAATDAIITQLQKEGYLSKSEAKTLKAARLDANMQNTQKASLASSSGGGRKKSSGAGSRAAGKTDFTNADVDAYIKSLSGKGSNDIASLVAKYSGKKFTTSFKAASAPKTSPASKKSSVNKKFKVQLG